MALKHSAVRTATTFAAALVAGLIQVAPARATQVVSGRMEADAFGPGQTIGPRIVGWTGPAQFGNLSTNSVYFQRSPSGVGYAYADAYIDAEWQSPDSGTVNFTSDGMIISQPDGQVLDDIQAQFDANWDYRFIADRAGTLTFDVNTQLSGDGGNIGFWQVVAIDQTDQSQFVLRTADGYAFGTHTIELTGTLPLVAGDEYEFALGNSGDSRWDDAPGFIYGTEGGSMTWSITPNASPVPEPHPWAFVLAGLALAGAGLRRTRRALG